MADPVTGAVPRCQWCSAVLPAADAPTCPSCGAALSSTAEGEIKGVTTLDPEAILRARAEVARPRNRLLSFITGEEPVEVGGETEQAAIAAPDNAVRREMLRLQLEAERADLEAEAVALKTDAVLEQGIDLAALADDGVQAEGTAVATADAGAFAPPEAPAAGTSTLQQPGPDAPAAPPALPPAPPSA